MTDNTSTTGETGTGRKPFPGYILPLLASVPVACLLASLVGLSGALAVACCLILLALALHAPSLRPGRDPRSALLEHQRRLADIVDFLPDATWAIDTEGSLIAWNKAAEELTGVKSEDLVGRNDFAYSVPFYGERRPILVDIAVEADPAREAKYQSFSRKGDTVEAEIFIPHFGTGGVFVWARARRLLDASGQVIGAIETVRDITERRRLQEVMMQTEKMVMVGGLAAGMAHEINNPLGAIVQNVQNIERRLVPGLAANDRACAECGVDFELMQQYLKKRGIFELLEMVSTAGARVAGIVAKMMSFSQTSSAILEPVYLDQLINQALDLVACDYQLKKRYDFRTLRTVREYDRKLAAVVVNRAEIEQALTNLIKNAIQALSPAGQGYAPRITVRTVDNGAYATMEIEDNGCGMTPEVSRRIFEPFFTTKEIGVGTGMGLAVTYALVVKNHHGSIEVESSPGKGTRFVVNLPLQPGAEA